MSRPLPALALAFAAVLAAPGLAEAHEPEGDGCTLEAGPGDLVAQDEDLEAPAGRWEDALVVRGDLVVRSGADVRRAIAVGGSVRVEPGATVREDAVAVGGDVRVDRGARVLGDALALGGEVRTTRKDGKAIAGDVVALSLTFGGERLAETILEELREEGPCRVRRTAGDAD